MEFLIIGIVLFFGIHLIPIFELKQKLINRFGKKPYMAIFAIVSALGLGLMIYGKATAEFIALWQPIAGAHWVPVILMWPAIIISIWAEIPCSMKITLRHPMLIGILIFTSTHLIANGDLATVLLFGSFTCYSIFTMFRQGFKKSASKIPNSTPGWNLFGVILGTVIYGLVFTFHQQFTGMVIPV